MMSLGAAARHHWALDPGWVSVNHGSFGAAPLAVLAAQVEWRRRMEAQPGRFMHRELGPALRAAAARLGRFLGVPGEDIGFVGNATEGCNAVLRSLGLAPDDEVLMLAHGYGAVRNTVRYVTERAGARTAELPVAFPDFAPEAVLAVVSAALTARTRLAVIDHVTSQSALLMPVGRIVATCHAAGVPVLIDGAHAPGQIPLDLHALGADWYVGNCHKWLCAPKGCGFLRAAPDRQAHLHPVVISHGYGQGFTAEFDWTGTRDPSAFLAVDSAIEFHAQLGGPALMARNAALAEAGAELLAHRLGTETGPDCAQALAMRLVRLPLAGPASAERAEMIRERLLDARMDAPVHVLAEAAWLRLSAHAYNEIDDYARLAESVLKITHAS